MQRLYKLDKNIEKLNDFRSADRLIFKVILSQWFLVSSFGGWFYSTYMFGFLSGGFLTLVSYIGYKKYIGTPMLRIVNSIVLLSFSIILIQQNLGRIEMHFHIFVMLSFLVAYKDYKPISIASIYIIMHHIFFTYLQSNDISFAGMEVVVFNYGCGYDIALLHAFFVLLQWTILFRLTRTSIKSYKNILRSKQDIVELNHELLGYKENLEKEVEKKTKELQLLNESLEKTIQDEIAKNSQKDAMINSQSRLASMGEMIGNIAHQWRQPLNALGITVQKMQKFYHLQKLDDEVMDKSVEKSMMLINKMSTTIDDFLGFFRQDKIKVDFDIKETIEETLHLLDASLKNNFIEVSINEIDEEVIINGYRGEFTQVILNIISNAKDILIEKKVKNPKIDIEVSKQNNEISLYIKDNGGGIPEDIIDKIFEPYFTTKEQGKGTGIGLYMSKVIIEDNIGGNISVQNTKDGACFIMKFKSGDVKNV
jgi:signal transduction histidine kinase